MVDWSVVAKALLFALFGQLTIALWAVTSVTYDNLLVPLLDPGALFPPLAGGMSPSGPFLAQAADFSTYLVENIVDPAVGVVAVGVGLLYLVRASVGRWRGRLEHLVPRLIVGVVVANFSLPLCGLILDFGGAVFPVISGFDGGKWQAWSNLTGTAELQFSWDNGLLAFVVSFVAFSLVLLLALAVALRDALLGVLIVLLPIFTLLGIFPPFSSVAKRAWLLFAEATFLPCVMIVPLELAVGSANILLLLGYLTVSLASPWLISVGTAQLSGAGFASAGAAVSGGVQRGLSAATLAAGGYLRPLGAVAGGSRLTGAGALGRSISEFGGRGGGLASIPLLTSEFLGHGAHRLTRHLARTPTIPSFPRVHRAQPPVEGAR